MDLYLGSALAFIFNLLIWLPFINQVYGHDVAHGHICVDRARKGRIVWYRDSNVSAIGHYYLMWVMRWFFKKENTRAYYSLMALLNSFTGLGVFLIAAHWQGAAAGFAASALFAVYNSSPRLEGNWAPFEHLISLPLVWSLWCLLADPWLHPWLLPALAGLLFGAGVLAKQIAAAYLPGYLLMAFGAGLGLVQVLVFLAGTALINLIPPLYYGIRYRAMGEYLTCVWLHLLPSAFNPAKYNPMYPDILVRGHLTPEQRNQRLKEVTKSMPLLVLLALAGFSPLFWTQAGPWFVLGFIFCLLASAAMIFMRGTYFAHYFLNTLPWLAIPAGMALWSLAAALGSPMQVSPPQIMALLALALLGYLAYRSDRHYYGWSGDEYGFFTKGLGRAGGPIPPQLEKYRRVHQKDHKSRRQDTGVRLGAPGASVFRPGQLQL